MQPTYLDMNPFQFSRLSLYLTHYIKNLPKNGRGEVSRLAKHLRVSTTLVSQVVGGHKVFTPEQIQILSTYLGLNALESDYLAFLIQHERAGTRELKNYWKLKLDELRKKSHALINRVQRDTTLTEVERAKFYSSPLYSAVRLYTSTDAIGKSLDEIATRFELTRARASEILNLLVEAGLCRLVQERYMMGLQKTHLEQGSPHLLRHHANWRLRAMHYSEDLSDKELMYTVPVSLSKKDFDVLREQMVEFIQKFLKTVHDSPAEDIACLNLDFFWIRK